MLGQALASARQSSYREASIHRPRRTFKTDPILSGFLREPLRKYSYTLDEFDVDAVVANGAEVRTESMVLEFAAGQARPIIMEMQCLAHE